MSGSAIAIVPWSEYIQYYRNAGTQSQHVTKVLNKIGLMDTNNILTLSSGTEVLKNILEDDRYGYILRVSTLQDLNELSILLLGKPLMMRMGIIHTEISSKYSADKISIWEGDFACVINTDHTHIRNQLLWATEQAEKCLRHSKQFCIEIELCDIMEGWYLQQLDLMMGCDDFHSTKIKKSRLILTNHKPINHCFDCKPKWWLCFGPCWLVSAPVYFIYRSLTCTDIKLTLKSNVSSLPRSNYKEHAEEFMKVEYRADGKVSSKLLHDVTQTSDLGLYGSVSENG